MKELEAIQFVHEQVAMDRISKEKERMAKETGVEDPTVELPTFPAFRTGDTIIVTYKIVEGDKTREQDYRGDVIQIKGHGATKTFTVRKISHGVGVERIFSVTNPNIAGISVIKRGKVRRARLYYLRGLMGKKARIKESKAY